LQLARADPGSQCQEVSHHAIEFDTFIQHRKMTGFFQHNLMEILRHGHYTLEV